MIAVAPTDADWLVFLRAHPELDTVNFWTPTPWNLKKLSSGDQFYFLQKGHDPRYIVGWGSFVRYENLKAKQAWERYGIGNGAPTYEAMLGRLSTHASTRSITFKGGENPDIGCIVLSTPVFLDMHDQRTPDDLGLPFAKQIVKLKYFDHQSLPLQGAHRQPRSGVAKGNTTATDRPRVPPVSPSSLLDELDSLDVPRAAYSRAEQQLIRQTMLSGATTGPCAICGEDFPIGLLVAAHIKRRADCTDEERRNLNNIMLACKFGCDELFERHYIAVHNGKVVRCDDASESGVVERKTSWLHGKQCRAWSPSSAAFFEWHRRHGQ